MVNDNCVEKSPTAFQRCFIIFFLLHSIRFFNLEGYSDDSGQIVFLLDVLFDIYFLSLFLGRGFNTQLKNRAWWSMSILYLISIVSIFIAYFQNGQTLYYGFRGISNTYLYLGFFYYLVDKKISPSFLSKIFAFFLIAFCIILIICYVTYPNQLFGRTSSFDLDKFETDYQQRGMMRFNLHIEDIVPLSLFYILSSTNYLKHKIVILFMLILLTLLRGTRGPMFFSIIVGIGTYLNSRKFRIQYIILLLIVSVGVIYALNIIPFTSNIIQSVAEKTSEDSQMGDDYYRWMSFDYYIHEFNKDNPFAVLFGNGPALRGDYADRIFSLGQAGMWVNDIEYIQWYIYFGLLGVLAILNWGYSFLKMSVSSNSMYLKAFICFIFCVMCLGSHFFHDVPFICIICYMLYIDNQKIRE